jgi:hypothetical protein
MARAPAPKGGPPPHDDRAEAAILGAALLSPDALATLATQLRPGDFYRPGHGAIAAAMIRLYESARAVDPVTVADELRRAGALDTAGGPGVLIDLQADTPRTSNVGSYATIVHDHATLRRLLHSAEDIRERAADMPADVHEAVIWAQQRVADVAANNGSRTYSSLRVTDIAALLAGNLDTEQATLLTRTDGRALLYAGKMHALFAEPSSGKSWLALLAALEILRLGGAVIYLDLEDSAPGIVGRLIALGADPADVGARFAYLSQDGRFGAPERLELDRLLEDLNPDLVVIDGVAVALARDGADENSNAEVAAWIERVPKPIAATGAAVLLLDHVTKDREKRGRGGRGAGHKLAALDGAAYYLNVLEPFSRARPGAFSLRIEKDRPGGVGEVGANAATCFLEPHGDGARVIMRLDPPALGGPASAPRKPTYVMGRISDVLTDAKVPVSATTLRHLVNAKARTVDAALAALRAEGHVIDRREGRSTFLRLVRPYTGPAVPDLGPTPDLAPPLSDELGEF